MKRQITQGVVVPQMNEVIRRERQKTIAKPTKIRAIGSSYRRIMSGLL